MRKAWAMLVAAALIAVSVTPLSTECKITVDPEAVCPHCHMKMSEMAAMGGMSARAHAQHAVPAARRATMPAVMRHCRIECCGHHDSLDGLPHLLAPHVAVWHGVSPLVAAVHASLAENVRPHDRAFGRHPPPPKRV